jgi:hypothetical protein
MSNTILSHEILQNQYDKCDYYGGTCNGKHNLSSALAKSPAKHFASYDKLAKNNGVHKVFNLSDIANAVGIPDTISYVWLQKPYAGETDSSLDTDNHEVSILVDPEVCHNCFDFDDWDWYETDKEDNILNMYDDEAQQCVWSFHTPEEVQQGKCKHHQAVNIQYTSGDITWHAGSTDTIVPTNYYVRETPGSANVFFYTGYLTEEDLKAANNNGCNGQCIECYTCQCNNANHGYFFNVSNACTNYAKIKFYWCGGHPDTTPHYTTAKLCHGHLNCVMQQHISATYIGAAVDSSINYNPHHSLNCPNDYHVIRYCTGHPSVQIVTKVIDAKSDAVYSDGWTYESTSPYGSLFGDAIYSPKTAAQLKAAGLKDYTSMAHDEWQGWNDDTKAQAAIIEGGDWYALYGMKHSDFIGGTLSEKERMEILAAAAIPSGYAAIDDELELNLQYAMDAVGTVPYFPNENPEDFMKDAIATVPYPLTPSDSPQTNSSNVMLGFHGVGHQYFAAYIDCVTRASPTHFMSEYLSNPSYHARLAMQQNPKYFVSSTKTAPGTPIARLTGGDFKTGIYIGVTSVELEGYVQLVHLYIGMDENGWCTVQSVKDVNGTMPNWFSLHEKGTTLKKVDTPAYSGGTSANNKNVTFTSEDFTTAAYVLFILCLAGFVIYMASKSKNKF